VELNNYNPRDKKKRKLYEALLNFDKALTRIGEKSTTVKKYTKEVSKFYIFLELIDKDILEVKENDLALYKEILLHKKYSENIIKTKIKVIKLYLYIYEEVAKNEGALSQDISINDIKDIMKD